MASFLAFFIAVTHINKKEGAYFFTLPLFVFIGGRHGIRTHDPRLRRPVLYPTELTAPVSISTIFPMLTQALC